MDLGKKIKKYRIDCGMEQKTLAQRLNISPKTVSSWEVNRTQPKMEMIEALCKVFDCKKSDFLDDGPSKPDYYFDFRDMSPDDVHLYARLMAAAKKCAPEEVEVVITILERFCREKED